jgi:glycosyltransferase involved in cell wall biosynthesis
MIWFAYPLPSSVSNRLTPLINNASRLLIVGKEDERLGAYTEALHQQVQQLGLHNAVVFAGEVSATALKAY